MFVHFCAGALFLSFLVQTPLFVFDSMQQSELLSRNWLLVCRETAETFSARFILYLFMVEVK